MCYSNDQCGTVNCSTRNLSKRFVHGTEWTETRNANIFQKGAFKTEKKTQNFV